MSCNCLRSWEKYYPGNNVKAKGKVDPEKEMEKKLKKKSQKKNEKVLEKLPEE